MTLFLLVALVSVGWGWGSYPWWGGGYPYGAYGYGYPYGYGYGYGNGYGGYPYGYGYGYSNGYHYSGYGYGYGGRSGSRVAELQRRLTRAGYYHGAIDGIMGPRTRRAIRALSAGPRVRRVAAVQRLSAVDCERHSGSSLSPPG